MSTETNEQWALRIAAEQIELLGTLDPKLETQFLALALERAIMRGYAQGGRAVLDDLAAATAKDQPLAKLGQGEYERTIEP